MLTTLLTALALALAAPQDLPAPSRPAEEVPLLDRVVLIGASVTAGFGLPDELDAKATLATFLDAAITAPHPACESFGSSVLFLKPIEEGEKQLEKALAAKPTLVVAVDFPFWFGCGVWRGADGRLRALEQGLKLLERIEAPLLVGDFPDMSAALEGTSKLTQGPMVRPSQIPSDEEREKLNARLREWVASRENVHLFELSRFVASLHDEAPLELRGTVIDAEAKKTMLQPCLLHPTVKGTCVLALGLLDELVELGLVPDGAVDWNLAGIEKGVWKATEAERQHRAERERRREERRRELEEKKRKKEGGGSENEGDGGSDGQRAFALAS